MGALVEAGGGYRVEPNVKAHWVITERQIRFRGRVWQPSPTQNFWNIQNLKS